MAIMSGKPKIAIKLLGLGADPNSKTFDATYFRTEKKYFGYLENLTPLHMACVLGYLELANQLVKKGADKKAVDDHERMPTDYFREELQKERAKIVNGLFDRVSLFGYDQSGHDKTGQGIIDCNYYTQGDRFKLTEYISIGEKLISLLKDQNPKLLQAKRLIEESRELGVIGHIFTQQDQNGNTFLNWLAMRPSHPAF